MTPTRSKEHDWKKDDVSQFGDWECRRCGAISKWYENGRVIEPFEDQQERLWDCDEFIVRRIMES